MQRANISLVCLLSLSLAGSALAQTAVDPVSEDSGMVSLQDYSGGATLRGTYFDIRHSMGDGVGYRNGYSQIGGFTPFWLSEDSFIAWNSRLLLTDNKDVGVSTGLVGRRYVEGHDRIYGLYGYVDSDESRFGNRYQQFAFGFETLGQGWDFRANGYSTFGEEDRFLNPICVVGEPFFVGNQLAFLGQALREEALSGGDFEFGVPLTPSTPWLRGYAGLYAYQSRSEDPVGVRGRIEAWVSDDLSIAVNVTEDRQFGTNVNAVVDFRFAGFKPTRYFPQWTTRERMLMPVQRNWRVATDDYVANLNITAINPADGQPYFVAHIDNSAAPGGDGSFERPFNTLPATVPGADIILVARGTTTEGAPLVGSIALEDNQRLLGEGCLHTAQMFAAFGDCTISGTFTLPGSTDSGNFPFLSSAGDIITLANNNEVAGFNLVNAGGDAITNTAAGSNNFLLRCLEITGNNGRGINLTNATGIGIIREVNLASGSTNHPNPGGFGNNLGGGIFIDSGAAGLDLTMTNVAMNSDPPGTQAFGVSLLADDGAITTTMTTVRANGNVTGIRMEEIDQTLVATLNDVSASDNTGVGVQIVGTGGTILLTSPSLTANNNGLDNLQIGTQAAPLLGTIFGGNISDSFFNNSVGGSGIVLSQSGGTGLLNLTNIQANGNGVDGLGLFGSAATTMDVNVINGFLAGNGRDAFHVEETTGATINLFVDPADGSGSGRDGLFFSLTGDSTLNATFLNTSLDNSGRSAVHGELDFSTVRLALESTTGANSGEHGLFLSALNNSLASVQVLDGTFAGSSQSAVNTFDAIHIESDSSVVNLGLTNTPGNNVNSTQRHGISLDIVNFSQFTGNVVNGNFTNNLTNAVRANVTSGSVAELTMTDTPSSNSGADGFFANVDSATFVANMTNSDFNNSGFLSAGNGLELTVTNDGLFTGNFDNSSFNSNGFDGMHAAISGAGSVASINLTNGSLVTNNGQDGLGFTVDDGRLNVTAIGSSFSNNGVSGVNGSGIIGLISNTGFVLLNLTDTPVSNNLDNGMFVTATGGSNIEAFFNNSPLNDNGVTTGGDGIRLDLDASPDSRLVLTNFSTVDRNGGDGFELNATNGTSFLGAFDNQSFTDNGQTASAGNGVIANVDASNVALTFNTVQIINNAGNTTQQIGFEFNVLNAGVLTAGFVDSNLSANGISAFDGAVDGVGSMGTVTLDNTLADSSGVTGAVFDVTAGGVLNFGGFNNSSISLSGASGIFVNVDGAGSAATFTLDAFALNSNGAVFGGEGFNGAASNQGELNACITNSSISTNFNQGIELTVADPDSIARFHVESTTVDTNGSEGLLADVSNEGTLLYRSVNSTYSGNGSNGGLAGVSVTAIGTGPSDTATALMLFSGDTVDSNDGDGFFFDAQNGATMTASLNSVSASNNGVSGAGFGVNFNASGANTKAHLLMTGNNQFNGNASGPLNVNVGVIDQVVLSFSGSYDNSPTDGINVNLTGDGTNTAIVAIQGPGTINNSTGNGIFVRLENFDTGTLLVDGLTSINDSGLDGIHVEFDTITQGAIEINGPTSINNSGDDAIDISVVNSNLVNNLVVPGGATIPQLTLTDNEPSNICLPIRVDVPFAASGLIPVNAFTINGMTIDNSGGRGINVFAQNTTVEDDGIFITNNIVSNSQAGDGLHLDFDNVTAPGGGPLTGVLIQANNFENNTGNGINLDLLDSPIDRLSIVDNLSGTSVNTALNFLIDGNTFPIGLGTGNFSITNASGPGIDITDFTFDTSTSVVGAIYNTETGAFFPFTPFGGTDATTGLATVTGTPVPPYPNNLVPDFSQLLSFTFTDFNPGETFSWDIDADLTPGGDESVFGNDLIGSTISVNFTGGLNLGGLLVAVPGNPDASEFVATSGNIGGAGIANNSLDGIRFSLTNSSLTNLLIDNNGLENNTGNGINFQTVTNSDITTATISNNTIDQNGLFGVRLINPQTAGSPVELRFDDNDITANGDSGIEIQVNNAEQVNLEFNSIATGNNVSGNGSFGLHVVALNTSQYTLDIGGPSTAAHLFNANTNAGIAIEATDATIGSVTMNNITISNTVAGASPNFAGEGFAIQLAQTAQVPTLIIGDPNSRNTTFDGNEGDGASIIVIEQSQIPGLLMQNVNSTNNGGDGISITRRDEALLSVDADANLIIDDDESHVQLNRIMANGNTGAGLNVLTTNEQFPTTRIDIRGDGINDDSHYDNNSLAGMQFVSSADAILVVNASDTSASGNEGPGISILTTERATFGNMLPALGDVNSPLAIPSTFTGMTVSGNTSATGHGFQIQANDDTRMKILMTTSGLTGARNLLDGNQGNGIQLTSNSNSSVHVDLNAMNILNTGNVVTGDGLNVTTNGGSDMTLTLTNAFIGSNIPTTILPGLTGDGIDITTNGASVLLFTAGNDLGFGAVDVAVYGNGGNGILVSNNALSSFVGNYNNVASRFNEARGYSAQITASAAGNGVNVHTIDDSNFSDNGREGIAFIANAGTHNQILVQLPNPPPANDTPFPRGDGNDFFNLNTDLQARLNLTNSAIVNNGIVSNSHGLRIAVSTNSQVLADVRNNTFLGNTLDDLNTSSFITTAGGFDAAGNPTGAAIQTNPSVDRSGVGSVDDVFLDDTAQLDLRFMYNTGDQVNVTSAGATYNVDAAKGPPFGRNAAIFQVNAFHTDLANAGATPSSFSGIFGPAPRDAGPADPNGTLNFDSAYNDPTGAGVRLTFNTGANAGLIRQLQTYNGATGLITTVSPFPVAPAPGNRYSLFLLDTNRFVQSGAVQDVHAAFQGNFATQTEINGIFGNDSTPMATYFNFPDANFPP